MVLPCTIPCLASCHFYVPYILPVYLTCCPLPRTRRSSCLARVCCLSNLDTKPTCVYSNHLLSPTLLYSTPFILPCLTQCLAMLLIARLCRKEAENKKKRGRKEGALKPPSKRKKKKEGAFKIKIIDNPENRRLALPISLEINPENRRLALPVVLEIIK